jgi:hypothetical protein
MARGYLKVMTLIPALQISPFVVNVHLKKLVDPFTHLAPAQMSSVYVNVSPFGEH